MLAFSIIGPTVEIHTRSGRMLDLAERGEKCIRKSFDVARG